MTFGMVAHTTGYVAVGFSKSDQPTMKGTDMAVLTKDQVMMITTTTTAAAVMMMMMMMIDMREG